MTLTLNNQRFIADVVFEYELDEFKPDEGWYIRLTERDNFTGAWNTTEAIEKELSSFYETLHKLQQEVEDACYQ